MARLGIFGNRGLICNVLYVVTKIFLFVESYRMEEKERKVRVYLPVIYCVTI